jgi:hypothetical protein
VIEEERTKAMGEAKDIVGVAAAPKSQSPDRPEPQARAFRDRKLQVGSRARAGAGTGVLGDLSTMVDRLDRAIEVKLQDLDNEPTAIAENHVKLGLLRGSSALIRRAKAMLEDYGRDLADDMDPAVDVG